MQFEQGIDLEDNFLWSCYSLFTSSSLTLFRTPRPTPSSSPILEIPVLFFFTPFPPVKSLHHYCKRQIGRNEQVFRNGRIQRLTLYNRTLDGSSIEFSEDCISQVSRLYLGRTTPETNKTSSTGQWRRS